jgi:hypothetical protein
MFNKIYQCSIANDDIHHQISFSGQFPDDTDDTDEFLHVLLGMRERKSEFRNSRWNELY